MRAVKILLWLVIVTVAAQLAGFIVMGLDGYDYFSQFFPRDGSMAEVGLVVTNVSTIAYSVLIFTTWIFLSLMVSRARDRIVGFQWMHGRGAVWGWWVVPIANYWMPRAVFLEIARNARPSNPQSVNPDINRWWGWFLVFSFSAFLGTLPVGPVYYVVVTTAALLAGVIGALALSSVLDTIATPEATAEGVIADAIDEMVGPRQTVMPTVPGWYYDPTGQATHQAFWDGGRWTGATRPDPRRFPDALPPLPPRNKWVIVVICIAVAVAIAATAFAVYLAGDGFADTLDLTGWPVSSR